jgi:hypothetical protein
MREHTFCTDIRLYTEHDKAQGRKVAGKRDKWVASLRELEVLHVMFYILRACLLHE